MAKSGTYWRILAACLALMVLATGCFQSIGDEAQPNAVSQARPSETPIPSETPTETATLEDLVPLTLSETPTETATATATATATLTITPTAALDRPVSDVGGSIVEQDPNQPDDGQLDPWELTATMIVLEITQTVEVGLTQTAQALGLGFPTATPTFQPVIGATLTPVVAQPTSFVSTGNCVHEVVVGENLFRLSMRYGVSIADLASASGITNIQLILVGQKIIIPGCGTTGVLPPPTSQPTQDLTTQNFGTGGAVTAQTAGTTGTTTTTIARTHTVQQYETLFEISLLYGVSVSSIANANGISNSNFVLMGTVLNIPSQ